MIDEKKIKEAATNHMIKEYCDDGDWSFPCDTDDIKEQCELDFKAGAAWAQREFVKSLWHDASEKPMAGRHVIALSKKGMFVYDFQFKEDDDNWARKFQLLHIERWAYLDDILPKEGGEE